MTHFLPIPWLAPLLLALLGTAAQANDAGTVRSGDLEMLCEAVASKELPAGSDQAFNVIPDPARAVLMVTIVRHLGGGRVETQPAQVYAGAIDSHNSLYNIPMREITKDGAVFYLGEFRIAPPDTLRFLVNANAAYGKPLKAEFRRSFALP